MRNRRNRGNWMPTLGTSIGTDEQYHYSDFYQLGVQVPTDNSLGGAQIGPLPIVPDFTDESSTAGVAANLHDRVSGNAWLLQRIVGKAHMQCYAGAAPTSADQVWTNILLTVGFFVARADDANQNVCDITAKEADPTQVDNMQNPWIWRRSWILGNPAGDSARYPLTCTGQYGSVADGPHIDSKVKRFITREHRLWMVLNARGFDPRIPVEVAGPAGSQPNFGGTIDLRVYGSLRRSKNVSSF